MPLYHYYAKPTNSSQGPGFAFDLDHELSKGSHYFNGQTYLCHIQVYGREAHEAGHVVITNEAGDTYLVGTITYEKKTDVRDVFVFDPNLVCGPPLVSRRKKRPWKREI